MVRRAADVPFLSSVELAELAGVSQPSVTRFAVALGFDGYPALRRHLREVAPAEQTADSASYNEYQQAVEAEIENLRHLAEVLADPRPVQKAGRLLAASRPLPVLGLRAAASQAYGFAYFAAKVHPDVRLLHEGGTMIHDRIDAAVRAGASTLLCFALPRHPREVVDTLAYAKEAGLTVVTVADSAFAPVAKVSDLLLPAAVGTGLAFDTACAPMLLGRVLLEAMCDDLPDAQARLEEFDVRAAARGPVRGVGAFSDWSHFPSLACAARKPRRRETGGRTWHAEVRDWCGWPSSYGPEPRPCGGPECSRRVSGCWCRASRAGGSASWPERRCSSWPRPWCRTAVAGATRHSGRPSSGPGSTTCSRTVPSECATGAGGTAGGCCWPGSSRWAATSPCPSRAVCCSPGAGAGLWREGLLRIGRASDGAPGPRPCCGSPAAGDPRQDRRPGAARGGAAATGSPRVPAACGVRAGRRRRRPPGASGRRT